MSGYWVCTESAYVMLLEQGYVTHHIERRHGVEWRWMILP